MDLTEDQIIGLFRKYETGELSPAENALFFHWYAEADLDTFETMLGLYQSNPGSSWSTSPAAGESLQKERLLAAITHADHAEEEMPPIRRINWLYWSAAASVVLLLAGMYLFRYSRPRPVPPPIQAVTLAPGGKKAILTLGNGTKILLDSSNNGTLAMQGGTQVVKVAGGLLAYRQARGSGNAPIFFNTVETPRGGEYQLILSDGTKVWLNAASSIHYPSSFSGTERVVDITGEAYFEIAKDKSRPFRVMGGGVQVQVLGTAFDMMTYSNEPAVKATLIEGSVRVTAGDKSSLIRPGQQAALEKDRKDLTVLSPDVEEVVAWKEGKFLFTRTSLKTIMRQIERWYDVDVVYEGNVDDILFTGMVSRKQYATQLLEILALDKRVRFVTEGRKITVIPTP